MAFPAPLVAVAGPMVLRSSSNFAEDWIVALSGEQVKLFVDNYGNKDDLFELWALAQFAEAARYPPGYEALEGWSEAIVPSAEGRALLEDALEEGQSGAADAKMALFGLFTYDGLLVDIEQTDVDKVRALVVQEFQRGRSKQLFRFGRDLYDEFNRQFPEGFHTSIPAGDAWSVVASLPMGLYQIGCLLAGPLGILRTECSRFIPPTSAGDQVLWHTREGGEVSGYGVFFDPPDCAMTNFYQRLLDAGRKVSGGRSRWRQGLRDALVEPTIIDRKAIGEIAQVVAECVVGNERTALLEHVIAGEHGKRLREVLSMAPRKKSLASGPAGAVAARLEPAQQLQLLMCLNEEQLAGEIDEAARIGVLSLGVSEVRRPRRYIGYGTPELGYRGVRLVVKNPKLALAGVIIDSYEASRSQDDLLWKVKASAGVSVSEAVFQFIDENGPEEAVERLILSSRVATEYAIQEFGISNSIKDDLGINLLWKAGFDPLESDPTISAASEALAEFEDTLLSCEEPIDEHAKGRLRAAGVNLFVSLETIIESVIVYLAWMMNSDHVEDTGFVFRYEAALKMVPQTLGEEVESGGMSLKWDVDGQNTFAPLLACFDQLLRWVEGLTDADPSGFRRDQRHIPSDAKCGGRKFAFSHTVLWGDCRRDSIVELSQLLRQAGQQLRQAQLPTVRNGLNHKRRAGDFPSVDQMSTMVLRIKKYLKLVEAHRLMPTPFWVTKREVSRVGATVWELSDGGSKRLELRGPSHLYGVPRRRILEFDQPVLVAPLNLLGAPNCELCFSVRVTNEFEEYWDGYPIVREIAASERTVPRAVGESAG